MEVVHSQSQVESHKVGHVSTDRTDSSASSPISFLTPKQYVEAVVRHSEQTIQVNLYPGSDYEKLAEYLQEFLTPRKYMTVCPYTPAHAFASVYTLAPGKNSEEHIVTPQRLQEQREVMRKEGAPANQLVFLRGHPSSHWLATVGASYLVDPVFFQSHLDFNAYAGRINLFSLPVTSPSSNIISLRYVTLGEWKSRVAELDQSQVDSLRADSAKQMNFYIDGLTHQLSKDEGLGKSIVRGFSVYDEKHFAIEQRITICLARMGKGWTVIAWIDTAQDLAYGLNESADTSASSAPGPWLGVKAQDDDWVPRCVYPTIQRQPHIALKSHKTRLPKDLQPTGNFVQSASLLHLEYGRSLNHSLVASDPFYATSELFRFCASSEAQLLNMLETKLISSAEAATTFSRPLELSNLLHMQKALKVQAERFKNTLDTIRLRGDHSWPRSRNEKARKQAEASADSLYRDYEVLLRRSESLSALIDDETKFLMNAAVMKETQGALRQAIEVTKLTRLASIYIPLSFTASFFGMNLEPLVSAPSSLWVYFALSIPVLLCSVVPLFWDIPELIGKLQVWATTKIKKEKE